MSSIAKMTKILKLRETLQAIGQITFNFSTLNRQYPMSRLNDGQIDELSCGYQEMIDKIKKIVNENENGGSYGQNT